MPLIIFWLTPIAIALVVLLWLLSQRPSTKPRLFLIEPLFWLVKSWALARVEGNEKEARRIIEGWLPGLEMNQSVLEQLCRQIKTTKPLLPDKDLAVLQQQTLPFWSELRQVEISGKRNSLLAGPASEVLEYCDVDDNGPLDQNGRKRWQEIANQAHRHGFLALALASSGAEEPLERRRFHLKGIAILEPEFDMAASAKLRSMLSWGKVKFISLLSPELIKQWLERLLPGWDGPVKSGRELKALSPKEQEKAIELSLVLGELAANSRYWAAKQLRANHRLILASRLSCDDELGCDERLK